MQAGRLTWFGHVERRSDDYAGKEADRAKADTKRKRGRQPMTSRSRVTKDLEEKKLSPEDVQKREKWRAAVHEPDPR